MKYNENRKRWELTNTEMLKRLKAKWEADRDAVPDDCAQNFHYFNGGVVALEQLLHELVWGDKDAGCSTDLNPSKEH